MKKLLYSIKALNFVVYKYIEIIDKLNTRNGIWFNLLVFNEL